ncbi:MAG: ABC transporter substrate-binding protein [Pseudomonadota bacterium]
MKRRDFMVVSAAAALGLAALPASAQGNAAAQLVTAAVGDIEQAINSGKTGPALYSDFERIFERYGDVGFSAQGVMGRPWRDMSNQQRAQFADSLKVYLSRKYGRRFREFRGAEIVVNDTRSIRRGVEVVTTVKLRGQSPFEVLFRVREVNGQPRFYDLVIEGISLVVTERAEIGAKLDARRGDVNALIADLRTEA